MNKSWRSLLVRLAFKLWSLLASAAFGLSLIGVATFALVLARKIERPAFASESDPGPKAFPVGLAICLLIGGVAEVGQSVWRWRSMDKVTDAKKLKSATPANNLGRWNVLILIVALALYVFAIPRLGFSLSTATVSILVMIRLGTRPWLATVTTVALLVLIQVLFVRGFEVQLPEGVLDRVL